MVTQELLIADFRLLIAIADWRLVIGKPFRQSAISNQQS
jgi:hypothetical protein